jgi:outer membrane lipoprotein LolB
VFSRRLFLLGLALALGGCVLQPRRGEGGAEPPRPPRAAIECFNLEGRLSVRQGENRHHVSLNWHHSAEADELFLSGPLGQGLAELHRDAGGARLLTSDRQSASASDWEELSAQVFGSPLPLSNLPRWLVADVPGSAVTMRDDQGRPTAAAVEGWRIDYLDYESAAAAALPTLLEFRRDDMELRLKIDTWSLE